MKQLKFLETKRTPRYSLRKFSVGMVSVLLGVTIFGINFTNHSVKAATTNGNSQQTSAVVLTTAERTNTQKATGATEEGQQGSASNTATANNSTEAATTLQSAPKTQGSAGSGASGSSATGVASGSQDSNSQAARTTSSAATDSQAAPETQVPAPANSDNATSSTASQAGTISTNQTSNTSAAGAPASSDQTVTVDETTLPATQAAILSTNLARLTDFKVGTRQRHSAMLLTNLAMLPNSGTDTPLPTTTQTYDKVEQPLLYDYGLHVSVTGTRDGQTWVDKTVAPGTSIFSKDYPGNTLNTIFGKTSKPGTGIIGSNPDKYFVAAYVDFSEQYHRVILLARSQDPSDQNLYSYTIHTYRQKTSTTTIKPGDSTKEQYTGVAGIGRSTYDLIFHNYGDSFTVKLNDFNGKWGMLPVFDGGLLDPTYGSNSYKQNDAAAQKEPISFWANAIPQETSTKVRYVDQATGKDIVQPMEISGFGYQGFKVKGDAPTVTGYHLVSKPEFLPSTNKASAYEDGTISPYKVGQTYDLPLSDSVVIKQTVINTDGTVRATAYYNGSPLLTSASKVLGRESYNDYMSFYAPDGKSYAYTNRIGQVDSSYIYYYAKDSDPKGSEMRLHFIDVTGVNNSSYAPSDGPELDADKVQTIHGNIGDNYSFTYTVPTNYYEVGSSDVTGKYSGTHHDAYVYVKKQAENKSNADQYTPTVSTPTVDQNATVDPNSVVTNQDTLPKGTKYSWTTEPNTEKAGQPAKGSLHVAYPDGSSEDVPVTVNVVAKTDKSNYTVTAGQPVTLTHGQKVKAGDSLDSSAVTLKDAKGQTVSLPDGAKVVWATAPDTSEVGNDKTGQAKVVYGDKSESEPVTVTYNVTPNDAESYHVTAKDDVSVDKGAQVDPGSLVKVTDPAGKPVELTPGSIDWKDGAKPDLSTSGDKTGEVEVTLPDGSKTDVPVHIHVNTDKGDTTDAGNITPTVPGGKVTVKDPSHLTDSEKDQVKKNVEDANKGNFPDGTKITVGDDGTTTVTYPDGSKDVIAGTDLIIAAKGEDVPGSKYHSHKNGSNSSQADRVKGASTANGSIANAGNNLGVKAETDNAFVGVKAESDNAIGNNKATSLKTLPQTGTKDTSILGVLGMLLASLGLFGFKKKRDKE